jgi:hypothetical protein
MRGRISITDGKARRNNMHRYAIIFRNFTEGEHFKGTDPEGREETYAEVEANSVKEAEINLKKLERNEKLRIESIQEIGDG